MKQDLIFYIVVHDINIILLYEKQQKYSVLKNYKYLLVGNHKKNFSNEKIIQCDKLDDNIEYNANYLAYTAWYVASKIDTCHEYICLLEYDSDLTDKFNYDEFYEQISNSNCSIFGFYNLPVSSSFLNNDIFSNKLISFLKTKGVREIKANNNKWIVTNNAVFKRQALVNLFEDKMTVELLDYLQNDKMSGHFLERYLSAFCFIRNIVFDFIKDGMLVHNALDSHNTQNRKFGNEGYEQFKTINKISNS